MEKGAKLWVFIGVFAFLLIQGSFIYFTFFHDRPLPADIQGKVVDSINKTEENIANTPLNKTSEVTKNESIIVNNTQVNNTQNQTELSVQNKTLKTQNYSEGQVIELKLKDVELCGADGGNMLSPSIADCIAGKMRRYYPACVYYCDNWTSQCNTFQNNSVRDCFYRNCDDEDEPAREKAC